MTNAELIAKIKAEIERRVDILVTVSVEQAKDGDSEMSTYYHGKAVSLEELIYFLDSLESEKPINLDDAMKELNEKIALVKQRGTWDGVDVDKYMDEVRGREPEKPVHADLEDAAEKHASMHPLCNGKPAKNSFIAGAKWQADHTPLPEDTVIYNKGVEEGRRLAEEEQADLFTIVALDAAQRAREQMMKEAVEWTVTTNLANRPVIYLDQLKGFQYGDKVRIIIVKED